MLQQIAIKDQVIDRLSKASEMLVQAKTIKDVKAIIDVTAAAKLYAKRQKLGKEAVHHAFTIELRATRKLGKILAGMPKNKGAKGFRPKLTTGAKMVPVVDTTPTLADIGINKKESQRAQSIAQIPEEQIKEVELGQSSLSNVLKEIKKLKRKADIDKQKQGIQSGALKMPPGVFEVIVMDPPWNYGREYDPDGSRAANPYPEMSQKDLLKLKPPFATNCALFLWTTHAFLWSAKELLDEWGFTYKATLVWNKQKIGLGSWFRMQCEFCLVAIKGKPTWNNTKWPDIINEARREHSRKPEAFYKMVEEITVGRRLDYFSRQRRDGWDSFGNETSKF